MIRKSQEYLFNLVRSHINKHNSNPYVMEFILGYVPFIFCLCILFLITSAFCILSFLGWISFGWVVSFVFDFLLPLTVILFIFITAEGCIPGIIPKILIDKKRNETKQIVIIDLGHCMTLGYCQSIFFGQNHLLNHFFPRDYNAVPAKMYCIEQNEEIKQKISAHKKPFYFYEKNTNYFVPKCDLEINLIMTRQKSDLLDRLIEAEPTAEFEITYLKHSRILKKIAPIPGHTYADGVAELCEEINRMYP